MLCDAVILTDGFVSLDEYSAADFISRCARLRFWPRQAASPTGPARRRHLLAKPDRRNHGTNGHRP